jgi:hypothetical protein
MTLPIEHAAPTELCPCLGDGAINVALLTELDPWKHRHSK